MPPVMMTNVIPIAINDIMEIWRVMFSRFSTVIKISVANANITTITISAITTANSRFPDIFFSMLFLFIFFVPHCIEQHFFFLGILSVHNRYDTPRGNNGNPVAYFQYLVHVGGRNQHRRVSLYNF